MNKIKTFFGCLLLANIGFTQMGTIDLSFNVDDNDYDGLGQGLGAFCEGESFFKLPNEKIVGCFQNGGANSFNGYSVKNLYALNDEGKYDPTFNSQLNMNFNSSGLKTVRALNAQSNGKIIAGGSFHVSINGEEYTGIVRLMPNGDIDPTFSSVAGILANTFNNASGLINCILVDENDNIYIAGKFEKYRNNLVKNIVKLNSDGSIDTSFDAGQLISGEIFTMVLQDDGKLLVGGYFTEQGQSTYKNLVRLNTNGTKDNTFNTGSGFDYTVKTILKDGNKYWIGGDFNSYNGTATPHMCLMSEDATLDNSFNITNGFNTSVMDIKKLSNGKLMVVGRFSEFNNEFANHTIMLNLDGTKESSYDNSTPINNASFIQAWEEVRSCMETGNNQLVFTGSFNGYDGVYRGGFLRLDFEGNSTISNYPSGLSQYANAVKTTNDDKMYVGCSNLSSGSYYKGEEIHGLFRIEANGNLDSTFQITMNTSAVVEHIATLSNNNVLVLGSFSTINGQSCNRFAILKNDGALIDDWVSGNGFNASAYTYSVLPDDKLLIGGGFTQVNNQPMNYLVRLNADGTIDNTFSIGTGFNSFVSNVKLLSDGKIFVRGDFSSYDGQSTGNIVLLNSDGTFHSTHYYLSNLNTTIYRLDVYDDGRILVGGEDIISYNNQPCAKIIRINADGTLDPSFNFVQPNDLDVINPSAFKIQSDGMIYVNNTTNFIKLNNDGSINEGFEYWHKSDRYISSFDFLSNGKIIAVGSFLTFANIHRGSLAVINNCNTAIDVEMIAQDNEFLTCTITDATSFQWYNCSDNQPIAGATSQSFAPSENGSYYVTANNGCSNTSTCMSINNVGISTITEGQLVVYPNPTNGLVKVQFKEKQSAVSISVTDVMGKLISTDSFNGTNEIEFALKGEVGLYNVVIFTDNGTFLKRIVLH